MGVSRNPKSSVVLALAALLSLGGRAEAQLNLPTAPAAPQLQLPTSPLTDVTGRLGQTVNGATAELDARAQTTLRTLRLRELIRSNPDTVEAAPDGAPILRRQVIAVSPSAESLARAREAGFSVIEQRTLADLELNYVVLSAPADMSTRRALRKLRTLDPSGSYDYNHLYTESGAASGTVVATNASDASLSPAAPGTKLGLIDGGIEAAHPVFKDVGIHAWGCENQLVPSVHGTAVASLMVGHGDKFRSAAAGAALYAADVYCGQPVGGALTTIAAALSWLAQEHVAVINISLVGPPNVLLEQLVRTMTARGHLIVAAVGNDGPAAPPLYPAAYPEVVAVTAVDARDRILLEAGRGKHVDFAAPGADMAAATVGGAYAAVRGTSFASPIVAGLLSIYMQTPNSGAIETALRELSVQAIDLGSRGPDKNYGRGLVGRAVRVAPDEMPVVSKQR